jgi:hypothetical protein
MSGSLWTFPLPCPLEESGLAGSPRGVGFEGSSSPMTEAHVSKGLWRPLSVALQQEAFLHQKISIEVTFGDFLIMLAIQEKKDRGNSPSYVVIYFSALSRLGKYS